MAYYIFSINRYLLQGTQIHLMDMVIANSGAHTFDVYLDGKSKDADIFKFLYRVGSADQPNGSIQIQNVGIYQDPLQLRIITNRLIPGHCVIRLYLKNGQGMVIGVLSEFQLIKVAD